MNHDVVHLAHRFKDWVEATSSSYHHSTPLIRQKTALILERDKSRHPFTLVYGLKELMLVGAFTQSSVLMTGGTDLGKTTLAKLIMNSLFGEEEVGWHRIDVDVDFGKETLSDEDFGVIKEGLKKSQGFYNIANYLLLPGLITDEINRSHSKLITKLMHVFDKDASLPDGQRAKIGYEYEPGKRYQYQISAINEGEDYSGTFDLDKAMRRRAVLEIPMDIFMASQHDRNRLRDDSAKDIELKNKTNHVVDLIKVYSSIDGIPLHPNAALFLSFLESFDYCAHSTTKTKGSVTSKGGSIAHICTKPIEGADTICPFIKSFENELCPYIRALSPGVSKKLMSVARGLALSRAVKFAEMLHIHLVQSRQDSRFEIENINVFPRTLQQYCQKNYGGKDLARASLDKYVSELSVQVEDILAVFGFVAYSKVSLSPLWVAKHYQGNRFGAVTSFGDQAYSKFEEGVAKMEHIDVYNDIKCGLKEGHAWRALVEYCQRENPWFLEAITPIMDPKKELIIPPGDLAYLYR